MVDLDARAVSQADAQGWANQQNFIYHEISAKRNLGTEQLFYNVENKGSKDFGRQGSKPIRSLNEKQE